MLINARQQIGVVHRITDKGDVRVQYDENFVRWTLHPLALVRVQPSASHQPKKQPPLVQIPGGLIPQV